MDDRELLEMAAKAAGIRLAEWNGETIKDDGFPWNPLTDDGDALRLAVKLGIHLQFSMNFAVSYAGTVHAKQFTERCDDPEAATRRAIVRAAAEIGKATSSPQASA